MDRAVLCKFIGVITALANCKAGNHTMPGDQWNSLAPQPNQAGHMKKARCTCAHRAHDKNSD